MKQLSVVGGLCLAMAGLLVSGSAQAALIDRGGGMLYDNVLNVTWLQDANYAKTSGYCNTAGTCFDSLGRMTWTQANTWANTLNYGGYSSGWRLARNRPVNGSTFNYDFSYNGSTDVGYNIKSAASELAYMYYMNLGLKGSYSPDGTPRSDDGIFGNGNVGSPYDQNDVGLVRNLQSWLYWAGPAYALQPLGARTWFFSTDRGRQDSNFRSGAFYAWAVRDDDVAAVPVPGSVALLAGGLALLGLVSRRLSQHR